MIKKEITEQEGELIAAIRNYKLAYPNGAKGLLFYIMQLMDSLLERD